MPTGTVLFPNPQARNVVDDVVSQARRAHDLGVRQVWLAQQFDHDAIALAALVIAAVPALVSDDVDAAHGVAAEQLSFYETIPSYQKVIAREGVESVADLAAVGSAESVIRQLRRYLDAGATDVVLSPLDRADAAVAEELWAVAAAL